jgi:peptide/nickel transport system substrate-binding protein
VKHLLLIPGAMALLLSAGCRPVGDHSQIEASVIGGAAVRDARGRSAVPSPADVLAAEATASGLVRLDRDGQVIAGAAARWAILDDGLDYIFRTDDAAGVSARDMARRLRAAIRARRGAADHAVTDAIASINAVTATVIEIRLSVPQPDLLLVLAQPEYGVGAAGSMRLGAAESGAILLQPRAGITPAAMPVRLRVEPTAQAVAGFVGGTRDLVLGGTFADADMARKAGSARGTLRFDPASGLFGLVLRDARGAVADTAVRKALGLAIDRDRIVALIGAPASSKATTLAGSAIEPALPERRAEAARLLDGRQIALRVAMPPGPIAQAVFDALAQDWAGIGVTATQVAPGKAADLALVDRVTPPGSRAAIACAISAGCDSADRLALIDPPFIPIAAPVRWSLVAKRLDRFVENALAAHPLDRLASK